MKIDERDHNSGDGIQIVAGQKFYSELLSEQDHRAGVAQQYHEGKCELYPLKVGCHVHDVDEGRLPSSAGYVDAVGAEEGNDQPDHGGDDADVDAVAYPHHIVSIGEDGLIVRKAEASSDRFEALDQYEQQRYEDKEHCNDDKR